YPPTLGASRETRAAPRSPGFVPTGPRHGPPYASTLGASRGTRAAPRWPGFAGATERWARARRGARHAPARGERRRRRARLRADRPRRRRGAPVRRVPEPLGGRLPSEMASQLRATARER